MVRLQWAGIVERAAEIVAEYDEFGGCTLRQCFYRLFTEGLIPNTPPVYRRLSAQLARARREEQFPSLIDPERAVHVPPSWPDVDAFVHEMPEWFRLDRTAGQAAALYVACEKDTLRAQVTGWIGEFGIPVLVVRGFGSQSYADLVRERTARDPRPAVLLYCGDSDASGDDIERDWVARTGCWERVERVLLTHTQVETYGLPAAEGKAGDPRWRAFAARYDLDPATPVQWEVEALPVEEFRRLVLDAVEPYVDRAILHAQLAAEEPQHRQLVALAEEWVAGRWRNRRSDGSANGEPP